MTSVSASVSTMPVSRSNAAGSPPLPATGELPPPLPAGEGSELPPDLEVPSFPPGPGDPHGPKKPSLQPKQPASECYRILQCCMCGNPPLTAPPNMPPKPTEPPVKQPAPVPAPPKGAPTAGCPPRDRGTVTVKPGDTLSGIASRFPDLSWQELWAHNKGTIKNPHLIYPGQVIKIPGCTDQSPAPVPPKSVAPTPAPSPVPPKSGPPATVPPKVDQPPKAPAPTPAPVPPKSGPPTYMPPTCLPPVQIPVQQIPVQQLPVQIPVQQMPVPCNPTPVPPKSEGPIPVPPKW